MRVFRKGQEDGLLEGCEVRDLSRQRRRFAEQPWNRVKVSGLCFVELLIEYARDA